MLKNVSYITEKCDFICAKTAVNSTVTDDMECAYEKILSDNEGYNFNLQRNI